MALIFQGTFLSAIIISVLLFFVLLLIGWLLRTKTKLSIGLFYTFFSFVFSAYILFYLIEQPGYVGDRGVMIINRWFLAVVIFIGVWVGTRIILSFIWDVYFGTYRDINVPVLLRNISTLIILLATGLLITRFVFLKNLSGLLVASGVTAAVAAFALRDFLSALIAGIALNIHPPFQVGDWVEVTGTQGEVININWRATVLHTTDRNHVIFPNSKIASEKIINFYRPQKKHAMRLRLSIEDAQPPTFVKETLLQCTLQAEGVRAVPEPKCRLLSFDDSRNEYELKFYIEDHLIHETIRDNVTTAIWYAFKRLDIAIPNPSRDIYIQDDNQKQIKHDGRQTEVESPLRNLKVFEPLKDEHISHLHETGKIWLFGKSENVVEQGRQGDSLFLILRGNAEVVVNIEGSNNAIQVGNLNPGDIFGEKSLFTGEPRGATVIAQSDLKVLEIEKKELQQILKKTPGLVERLSEVLAERRLVNEGFFEKAKKENEVDEARKSYSNKILKGMRSFFSI